MSKAFNEPFNFELEFMTDYGPKCNELRNNLSYYYCNDDGNYLSIRNILKNDEEPKDLYIDEFFKYNYDVDEWISLELSKIINFDIDNVKTEIYELSLYNTDITFKEPITKKINIISFSYKIDEIDKIKRVLKNISKDCYKKMLFTFESESKEMKEFEKYLFDLGYENFFVFSRN